MMAGFIPIEVAIPQASESTAPLVGMHQHLDAVLIDDDPIVHLAWKTSERRYGRKTRKFTDIKSFEASLPEIDRKIPIYIDQNLGNGIKGTDLVEKVRQAGFHTIYLSTGEDSDSTQMVPGLTAVIGKEPPWLTQLDNQDQVERSSKLGPGSKT
jgi:hypothetical protein